MPTIKIEKLLNITIICLSIIVVLYGLRFVSNYSQEASWDRPNNEDDFIYAINEKRYSDLVNTMYLRKNDSNPRGDLKEYLAIAEYYRNTSFYKMYKEVGDVEKADKYLAQIDENKKNIVDLTFIIDEINEELGVVYME